jgi:HlyD family secretion protein
MTGEPETAGRKRRLLLTLLGVVVLAGLFYGGFHLFSDNEPEAVERNYSLITPQRGEMSATVNASGSMQPRQVINLDFATSGVVVRVLVEVGDSVRQGEPLAQLDTSELNLRLTEAQAALAQAQATYEQLQAGATPAEIARAQAQVEQAQAQLQQTRGTVTEQDIAAARAQLEQARANLQRLEAGADTFELAAAQASLDRARANLQSQRSSLSAAKTQARSQMQQAANTLRNRQDEYSQIYWDNREIERELGTSDDLTQRNRTREEQALRAVNDAEESLEQARTAYEEAQQAEISGIQAAEADVRNAEATLDDLLAGAERDELAAARAQVAQAEASLAQLLGEERTGSLQAAQANVESAQANLENVTADPREVDLASALAQIQQSQAALEQAELEVRKATLRAPMSGTIAETNLTIGESPDAALPDIVLADLSGFYVDVTVDEIDVASLALDQQVTLTLDALPELLLRGVVDTISPLSTEESAVTTYEVRIRTPADDPRVRAGMSATADIIVAQKDDALVVPRRAVRTEDGELLVDVPVDQSLCAADPDTLPAQPELEAVSIEVGLRNDTLIEVADGDMDEQTCVYVEGFDPRMTPFGGPPPGHRQR